MIKFVGISDFRNCKKVNWIQITNEAQNTTITFNKTATTSKQMTNAFSLNCVNKALIINSFYPHFRSIFLAHSLQVGTVLMWEIYVYIMFDMENICLHIMTHEYNYILLKFAFSMK